jgi:hypothetical protein
VSSTGRAIGWLLGVPVLCLAAGCSRDTSDAGPRAAAAVVAIALQSDEFKAQRAARALPVELDYQIPPELAAGQPAALELVLRTELASGVLEIDIDAPPGVVLNGPARRRFDLAIAPRPLRIVLELAPTAVRVATRRPLTIEVTGRQDRELRTRVFQIVLPPWAALDPA